MRDQISTIREEVASELQREAGERVRIRIRRNVDHLAYQQMLVDGLRGARVRNHEEIRLMQLRPEQLAQLVQSNDLDSFEELTASQRATYVTPLPRVKLIGIATGTSSTSSGHVGSAAPSAPHETHFY
jgi:hypothetical protein